MPDREHETCDACGFDGAAFADAELLAAVRALGARWRAVLGTAGARLRTRPAPTVWSPLEYAAHTRDVVALHVFGVEQALTGDEPVFPEVEEGLADAAAGSYAGEDVTAVLDGLAHQADRLAALAAEAGPAAWDRAIVIGEARRDVRRLLEHALHDAVHHLDDVERGLTAQP